MSSDRHHKVIPLLGFIALMLDNAVGQLRPYQREFIKKAEQEPEDEPSHAIERYNWRNHKCGECKRLKLKKPEHREGTCWIYPQESKPGRTCVDCCACKYFIQKEQTNE